MVVDSCCIRNQWLDAISENLAQNTELQPFISAWGKICQNFDGIQTVNEEYDPVLFIYQRFERELARTADIHEELFLTWLMQLPVLKMNFVNKQLGTVWEPTSETFYQFSEHTSDIVITDCKNVESKLMTFSTWVIGLCDWEKTSLVSSCEGMKSQNYLQ